MTKTVWHIVDETEKTTTNFTYYHFGKEPKFPSWYMEANHHYTIEMIWHFKLVASVKSFFKCLTHFYIVK